MLIPARLKLIAAVTVSALAALWMCGCSKPTSRENAVQTPDKTGMTWFEPVKGAR